jgi:NAD(P)-dependent dehydrogenase (short-subunit alcohol dehydrogenase family)
MELGLGGKSVVITGASKGIGRGIAEEFAVEGACLTIAARRAEELEEAARQLRTKGVAVTAVTADVTVTADLERLVQAAIAAHGRIDVLVNNAGEGWLGRSWDTTDAQWAQSLDLNLLSAVRLTRLVVPHLKAIGQGRIINVSSVSGHTMAPGVADYQTTKAAMIAFSKSMALDLAPDGILVNTVCPGLTRTPLWDRIADSAIGRFGATREEVYSNAAAQAVPLGRHATVAEIAAVVVFLASERASYVSGATYDVDGGYTKTI